MTCPGSLPPGYANVGFIPAVLASRVTSFPPDQQLTKLCKATGCDCLPSGHVACLRYSAPFFPYYTWECSHEWCYCFENKENEIPIQPNPSHPNVAANNRAPANVGNAPPIAHHRKKQPPGALCAGWNDCAGENYVCKVPSSAPRQTQPQPGTCTWLTNIAAAAVASSALGTQCQRGRCLAESNGTVSANGSSPFLPTPQLTVDAKDAFACACNCTYVSKSCCSTADGNVYEEAINKVSEVAAPPGSFCNAMTGDFQDMVNRVGETNNTVFSDGLWGR